MYKDYGVTLMSQMFVYTLLKMEFSRKTLSRKTQSSFCISLNTKNAEALVLSEKTWPVGARVRPFNPLKSNKQSPVETI